MASRERAITDVAVQWRMLCAALRTLRRETGARSTAIVLARVTVSRLLGKPWKGLPPPEDEKERLSRAEIGDAVLLYRALLHCKDPRTARDIVSRIVVEGAHISFDYLLDPLHLHDSVLMEEEDRRSFALRNLSRFPNADVRLDEAGPGRLAFTVLHCRFPKLLEAIGHPDLAPIFCSGDRSYFEERLGVAFERSHTIAEGAPDCPFVLTRPPGA